MDRIASPHELQFELRRLLAYCREDHPSREKLAEALNNLADRVAGTFTEQEWKTYKQKHPGADPRNHTITKGDKGKGRDLSKEEGFGALKGLSPAKQREVVKKVLLNMEAEEDEKKKGPTKQRDVSKEEGFEALKGLSPAAQRRLIERALKMKD